MEIMQASIKANAFLFYFELEEFPRQGVFLVNNSQF
jgi:hypothetical protein